MPYLAPYILTKSNCTFPLTSAADGLVAQSPADCTRTYAQGYATTIDALQAVTLAFSVPTALLSLYRIHRVRAFAKATMRPYWTVPSAKFHIAAALYATFLSIQCGDLFGYAGVYPLPLFKVLDELVAVMAFIVVMLLVDFWMRLSAMQKRHGLPPVQLAFVLAAITVNFLGFVALQVADPDHFLIYETCKAFGTSMFVVLFLGLAHPSVMRMSTTLTSRSGGLAPRESSKQAAKVLKRKYYLLAGSLGFTAVFIFVNTCINMASTAMGEWKQTKVYGVDLDAARIAFRSVYLLGCIVVVVAFRAPKLPTVKAPHSDTLAAAGAQRGDGLTRPAVASMRSGPSQKLNDGGGNGVTPVDGGGSHRSAPASSSNSKESSTFVVVHPAHSAAAAAAVPPHSETTVNGGGGFEG